MGKPFGEKGGGGVWTDTKETNNNVKIYSHTRAGSAAPDLMSQNKNARVGKREDGSKGRTDQAATHL